MTPRQQESVHAELGELAAGLKTGRSKADEITIFDGSGVGIQDVAAATRAYELARQRDVDQKLSLA